MDSLFDVPPPDPRQPYRGRVPCQSQSETSAAAAEMIRPRHHELQVLVLGFVRDAGEEGLTAEEAGVRLAEHRHDPDRYAYSTRSTAAARMTELKLLGQIRDSGRRRQNRSGATAAVWVATPPTETR